MTEYRHPILIKGGYQVMAITEGREYDPSAVVAYAVVTLSGAKIRHELSIDSAMAWMDRLVDEEAQRLEHEKERPVTERPNKRRSSKRAGKGAGRKLLRFLG